MKEKKINLEAWLKYKLRRVSLYWPERKKVFHRIKTHPGSYQCENCKQCFKQSEIHIDHINPVVKIEDGFVDWNTFIGNLFCESSNLQGLCKPCHKIKTDAENVERRKIKKDKKKV